MTPTTFTFAVYPADFRDTSDGGLFDSFLLDVPSSQGEDAAARRAWWTAFSYLQRQGAIEPEDFNVCCWRDNAPGPLVLSGGIEREAEETPWTGGWPA